MGNNAISAGTWARVRLHPGCLGDGRHPHHPAEDDMRVQVTVVGNPGDHSVFALYRGGVAKPAGGRRLGSRSRSDAPEIIPEPTRHRLM